MEHLCNVLNIVLFKKSHFKKKKKKEILNSVQSAQGKYNFKHNASLHVPLSLQNKVETNSVSRLCMHS